MRHVHGHGRFKDLDEFSVAVAGLYRKDYWATSEVKVEVWLDKDSLKGVLEPTVVDECGLGLHVARSFASITYLQEAARDIELDGRPAYVYVFADFDPSGVSIVEKVEDELAKRAPASAITVKRLAVDRAQIERWSLPTRPTRAGDLRASKFRRAYGTDPVELDAIPPEALRGLVRETIESHMDPRRLEQLRMVEREERGRFRRAFGSTY
jgi:hypothetical protein